VIFFHFKTKNTFHKTSVRGGVCVSATERLYCAVPQNCNILLTAYIAVIHTQYIFRI